MLTSILCDEILEGCGANLGPIFARIAESFEPREPMPTAEFAEKSLVLPQEVAEQHGYFQMRYAPHLYGIFSAFDDPKITEIVCMKAAQVAWTTALIAYLANRIVNQPCAMIGLFDSEGSARDFHDEKLVPIIEATPELLALIDTKKARTSGNRADFKRFPGGFLKLGGSGQIRKLKSTSAGVLVVEEPDDAQSNVKDQGDAVQLLWERSKRRRNVKRILGGTPSLKGFSQVEYRIDLSDKRVLPIECHECRDKHVIDLENVSYHHNRDAPPHPVYGTAMPETAVYVCPECGTPWDDNRRKENIRATVQKAIMECDPSCGWTATRPFSGAAGFLELNEGYSCLPGVGMQEFVKDKLEAEHAARQGDQNKLIVFVNSKHGRPYEFKGEHAQRDELLEQALIYDEGTIPSGGLVLCAGMDVQHDRLSILLRAYGKDKESWLVLWREPIAKRTTSNEDDPVYLEAEKIIFETEYPGEKSTSLKVRALTVDTSDGQTNDAVYTWIIWMRRKYPRVKIFAGKGPSSGDPEIFTIPKPRPVQPRNPERMSKADRYGLRIHMVGTNRAKDYLSGRWLQEAQGHGRHHAYRDVREDYWDQITSEVKAPCRRLGGKNTWQKKVGTSNEGLDCEVYAEHASRGLGLNTKPPGFWAALEARTDTAKEDEDKQMPKKKAKQASRSDPPHARRERLIR